MEPTVKQSIETLRETLKTQAVASDKQSEIDQLLHELHNPTESETPEGLVERLDKALILFDDDHPDVASAIRSVIHVLTQSGI
jgi:hypothetical protein